MRGKGVMVRVPQYPKYARVPTMSGLVSSAFIASWPERTVLTSAPVLKKRKEVSRRRREGGMLKKGIAIYQEHWGKEAGEQQKLRKQVTIKKSVFSSKTKGYKGVF